MKIFKYALVLVGSIYFLNCTGEKKTSPKKNNEVKQKQVLKKPTPKKPEVASAKEPGNIKITVKYAGVLPKPKPVVRDADPYCAKIKKMDASLIVSSDGLLQNALVKIDDRVKGKWEVPKKIIQIDQKECEYSPRVSAVMKGQVIQVTNSDKTLHNVHGYKGEKEKNWFNRAQPPNSIPFNKSIKDDIVRLRCDVHPWMNTWISSAPHPFNQVTSKSGIIDFINVPARSKPYTIKVWHETLGIQKAQVKVESGKTSNILITYK